MKLSSSDIKIGLRSAFPTPGWQVFFEVGDDTGVKQRRWADAVAMGIWPSNGHLIHGMEIKVSRGDFLSEMKNPTKAQAIFRFCNRWSLVTPPGLVQQNELPETWGLMTYDGKVVRTVKKAPPLQPEPPTAGFIAAMLRRAGECDAELITSAVEKAQRDWAVRQDQIIESRIEQFKRNHSFRANEAVEQLAAYRALFGDMTQHQIAELAPALNLVRAAGITRTYGGITHLQKQLADAATKLGAALSDFEPSAFDDLLGS